jgi:SAM-dependent methyltransferase
MSLRNYDLESSDNEGRMYKYDFDLQIRKSLIARFNKLVGLDSKKTCLEVGSFDGSMTELLLKSHNFVTVVEPSHRLSELLLAKFGDQIRVIESTIENVGLENKFDYIYLIHTLEHLDSPADSLKHIGELLNDGGFLFVAVPNARALSRQIATEMGIVDFHTSVTDAERLQGHCRTYTLDALNFDLKSSGLSVLHCGGVLLKTLANFQFDASLSSGVITQDYIDALDRLSEFYPDLSSSIFAIVQKNQL